MFKTYATAENKKVLL